ncbi:hypothetical protein KC131_15170 [Pseudomonas sp. JQ170]|uniref:DUF7375 domain-containing protein n=1 Tax=unclassified Pseudomonas TaxID=196821 RepID=UPI00264F21DD|nr:MULTISPECIES: hypothetical protein [unclassified Pseudomonas]MDN7141987.1 hypothetical protein [Pseudomonas sp. JQ170]WRO78285.1 hypothetical protein U9R80_11635 [Pseudomonas sp. 170C]
MKLTKAQQKFFTKFVEDALRSTMEGVKSPDEIDEFLTSTDLTPLVSEYGTSLLQHVDFPALKRVDRFLRSEEYQAVMSAITQTLTEVTRRTDEAT